jgi:heat-inducible transcriptional repressor
VRIGSETGNEGLATMALVSSTYGAADGGSALGTLGPTRMDYPGTIAAVAAVARYVGRLLNED